MKPSGLAPHMAKIYIESILKQKTIQKPISKKSILIFSLSSHPQHFCPQTYILVLMLALKFSNQNRAAFTFFLLLLPQAPKTKK